MILSLNPEQFLTVYYSVSLNSSLTAQEIKAKMDTQLLDALSFVDDSKNQSKFSTWVKFEKEKLDTLEKELKTIKTKNNVFENTNDDGLPYRPT